MIREWWDALGRHVDAFETPYAEGGDPRFFINKWSHVVDDELNPDYDVELYGVSNSWNPGSPRDAVIGSLYSSL